MEIKIINIKNIDISDVIRYKRLFINKWNINIDNFFDSRDKMLAFASQYLILQYCYDNKIPVTNIDRTNNGILLSHNKKNNKFSISHSGNYCVFIEKSQEIGIDIQHLEQVKFDDISKRIMNESEHDVFNKLGKTKQLFYTFWCCKESFVKLSLQNMLLKDIEIKFNDKDGFYTIYNNKKYFFNVKKYHNYLIAVCSSLKIGNLKLLNTKVKKI